MISLIWDKHYPFSAPCNNVHKYISKIFWLRDIHSANLLSKVHCLAYVFSYRKRKLNIWKKVISGMGKFKLKKKRLQRRAFDQKKHWWEWQQRREASYHIVQCKNCFPLCLTKTNKQNAQNVINLLPIMVKIPLW